MHVGVVPVRIFVLIAISILLFSGCTLLVIKALCEPYVEYGKIVEPCVGDPVEPPETIL